MAKKEAAKKGGEIRYSLLGDCMLFEDPSDMFENGDIENGDTIELWQKIGTKKVKIGKVELE